MLNSHLFIACPGNNRLLTHNLRTRRWLPHNQGGQHGGSHGLEIIGFEDLEGSSTCIVSIAARKETRKKK